MFGIKDGELFFSDRRRFIRIPCESVLTYTVLKKDGSPDKKNFGYVRSKNISLGGILFTSLEFYPKGTWLHLKLRMDIEKGCFEEIEMTCVVIRSIEVTSDEVQSARMWDMAVYVLSLQKERKKNSFINWLSYKDSFCGFYF